MAKKEKAWKDLDMQMMPTTGHIASLGEEFILFDNIGLPQDQKLVSQYVGLDYPFKIPFTFILFCVKGEMQMLFNLEPFSLAAGTVMIGMPGNFGQVLHTSGDNEVAVIIYKGWSYTWLSDNDLVHRFQKVFSRSPLFWLSGEQFHDAMNIYHQMHAYLSRSDFRFVREALLGCMQVLSALSLQWIADYLDSRSQTTGASSQNDRAHQYFEKFLDLVRTNYSKQRDIKWYADQLCLTPKYLSTIIYRVSGRHAGDWIREYVLLEAKTLLRSRQYTVQQVCDQLGFSNPSFFGKYFKAAVGVSPGQYMAG